MLWVALAIEQPTPLLLMGGDFANSTLGDPSDDLEVFRCIKIHPWIQLLSFNDFVIESRSTSANPPPFCALPNTTGTTDINNKIDPFTQNISSNIYQALQQAPDNTITYIAWKVYDLVNTQVPAESATIRSNYLWHLGEIISP